MYEVISYSSSHCGVYKVVNYSSIVIVECMRLLTIVVIVECMRLLAIVVVIVECMKLLTIVVVIVECTDV